jgi:hypothetical protein
MAGVLIVLLLHEHRRSRCRPSLAWCGGRGRFGGGRRVEPAEDGRRRRPPRAGLEGVRKVVTTSARQDRTIALRARNKRAPDLRRGVAPGRLPGHSLAGTIRYCPLDAVSPCPQCAQLPIARPDLPGPMTPHPCVCVAVDEQQVVPDPRPPGHQIKTRARALWREASSRPAGLPVAVSSRPAKERSPAKTGSAGPTRVRVPA